MSYTSTRCRSARPEHAWHRYHTDTRASMPIDSLRLATVPRRCGRPNGSPRWATYERDLAPLVVPNHNNFFSRSHHVCSVRDARAYPRVANRRSHDLVSCCGRVAFVFKSCGDSINNGGHVVTLDSTLGSLRMQIRSCSTEQVDSL